MAHWNVKETDNGKILVECCHRHAQDETLCFDGAEELLDFFRSRFAHLAKGYEVSDEATEKDEDIARLKAELARETERADRNGLGMENWKASAQAKDAQISVLQGTVGRFRQNILELNDRIESQNRELRRWSSQINDLIEAVDQ